MVLPWLWDSFDNPSFSDLTLVCGDKSYNAHRAIVCPQSPVIARKLQSQFQSIKQDRSCDSCGVTSKYHYDLSQDDPQAVDCLIQYFYRQGYMRLARRYRPEGASTGKEESESSISSLEENDIDDSHPILHVKVYALAELYDVRGLKQLALDKFRGIIHHNSRPDRFLDGVEEAYASTISEDRGLRDVIINFFQAHPELVKLERVQRILKETHSLTYDLFMHSQDKQAPAKKSKFMF
ncbi:unnamed protein product [Fusarium equiseti]|uniref:BTB domain-containing protein n=1 Tax=Fusarium equiseti TaxID=61235 RepID=A0A8J2NFH9_FUSEQ|nr:unnamed protein product [Fusarium equiseti]